MTKIGISACLGFNKCRYDGSGLEFDLQKAEIFLKKELNLDEIEFVPVCPEQLGGLPTPRMPAEIQGGTEEAVWAGKARVNTKEGTDVTKAFRLGAVEVFKIAVESDIKAFILKENSPSCGTNKLYSGNFNGEKISGNGVTAELLKMCGIKTFSEEQIQLAADS